MHSANHQSPGDVPPPSPAPGAGESCRISFSPAASEGGISSLGDLDRLDHFALAVLLLLIVAALGLMVFQPGATDQIVAKGGGARQGVVVATPDFDRKLAGATALLNGGDPAQALALLDALIAEFPYEGGPHMLKGDFYLREQRPLEAMLEFRQGVDLNPDYLDKKMTAVFQGKKVKSTLEEAQLAIAAGLARNPGDATLRHQREVLYYMLRKVAGSCG